MSTIDQIAAKTTATFDDFCGVLQKYQAEAAIATAGAVWAGLALQHHGVDVPTLYHAVREVAASASDIWDAAERANCSEQVKQLGEFAAKGFLTPIFTTDAGIKMLASAPGESLHEIKQVLSEGCDGVREMFERADAERSAEAANDDDSSPSP